MDTVLSQQNLEELLDQAVQEVAEQTAGVRLYRKETFVGEDLCTIHITFNRGFRSCLSLCADTALVARMARNAFGVDELTPQDLEDFGKEYCNMLCGKIAAFLFRTTQVAARFSVPSFFQGRFVPEDFQAQFALSYSDDQPKSAQLTHYIPCLRECAAAPGVT